MVNLEILRVGFVVLGFDVGDVTPLSMLQFYLGGRRLNPLELLFVRLGWID